MTPRSPPPSRVPPGGRVMMPNTFLSSLKHMWQPLLVTFVDLAKMFWSDLAPWGCLGGSCCIPGGPGSKLCGPCYNLIIVEQNFKGTFFDSTNGLGAHKGQSQRQTHRRHYRYISFRYWGDYLQLFSLKKMIYVFFCLSMAKSILGLVFFSNRWRTYHKQCG